MGPGQPYGDDALAYLSRLVGNHCVRVEIYGVDPYHRLLATAFLDGYNLNLALVEAGLAEVSRYPGPWDPYQVEYETAETAARAATTLAKSSLR
jgi:endonuclease YncB( thermonuclease family)